MEDSVMGELNIAIDKLSNMITTNQTVSGTDIHEIISLMPFVSEKLNKMGLFDSDIPELFQDLELLNKAVKGYLILSSYQTYCRIVGEPINKEIELESYFESYYIDKKFMRIGFSMSETGMETWSYPEIMFMFDAHSSVIKDLNGVNIQFNLGDDSKVSANYINIICDAILNFKYEKSEKQTQKTYLMIDSSTGLYKIGKSKDPKYRETTLQSEKPTIKLICTCDLNLESQLHREFADKRVRGEWFKLNEADIKNIKLKFQTFN